ncbi:MAG: hypothetical protein ACI4OR_02725 [Alphaproteobacteria bacterium]
MTDSEKTSGSGLKATLSGAAVSDKITLWHFAKDSQALKSFLNDGAKAIGIGKGGQTNGFFVWNQKKGALSHFKNFLYKEEAAEGVLVGVNIHVKDIGYPTWQFDVEIAKALNPLLFKYKKEIAQIQDLAYTDCTGEHQTISKIRPTHLASAESCVFQFKINRSLTSLAIGNNNGIWGVDMFQAVIDHMCQNPEFKKEYDTLLQEKVKKAEKLAVKYCGQENLPVDEIVYVHKNEQEIDKEQQLYTSSAPKEKQVCPFFIMAKSKRNDQNL